MAVHTKRLGLSVAVVTVALAVAASFPAMAAAGNDDQRFPMTRELAAYLLSVAFENEGAANEPEIDLAQAFPQGVPADLDVDAVSAKLDFLRRVLAAVDKDGIAEAHTTIDLKYGIDLKQGLGTANGAPGATNRADWWESREFQEALERLFDGIESLQDDASGTGVDLGDLPDGPSAAGLEEDISIWDQILQDGGLQAVDAILSEGGPHSANEAIRDLEPTPILDLGETASEGLRGGLLEQVGDVSDDVSTNVSPDAIGKVGAAVAAAWANIRVGLTLWWQDGVKVAGQVGSADAAAGIARAAGIMAAIALVESDRGPCTETNDWCNEHGDDDRENGGDDTASESDAGDEDTHDDGNGQSDGANGNGYADDGGTSADDTTYADPDGWPQGPSTFGADDEATNTNDTNGTNTNDDGTSSGTTTNDDDTDGGDGYDSTIDDIDGDGTFGINEDDQTMDHMDGDGNVTDTYYYGDDDYFDEDLGGDWDGDCGDGAENDPDCDEDPPEDFGDDEPIDDGDSDLDGTEDSVDAEDCEGCDQMMDDWWQVAWDNCNFCNEEIDEKEEEAWKATHGWKSESDVPGPPDIPHYGGGAAESDDDQGEDESHGGSGEGDHGGGPDLGDATLDDCASSWAQAEDKETDPHELSVDETLTDCSELVDRLAEGPRDSGSGGQTEDDGGQDAEEGTGDDGTEQIVGGLGDGSLDDEGGLDHTLVGLPGGDAAEGDQTDALGRDGNQRAGRRLGR